ncbi:MULTISPECIES: hypothetical protein [Luteimonas]|uniref:hypothetical protein n=1 Tax=Luteimonas TaxID=83614 RepID=UPI001E3AB59C|nr:MULTISPECIES: hypothetical protein [Luteimonas]
MSIGTADDDTERGWLRLPSTETVSSVAVPSVSGGSSCVAVCASAALLLIRSALASASRTADANGACVNRERDA